MALGDPYTTTPAVKGRIKLSTAVRDEDITSAIAAATAGINLVCGRDFQLAEAPLARRYPCPNPYGPVFVDDIADETNLVIECDYDADGVYETPWTGGYELSRGTHEGIKGWPYVAIQPLARRWWPCYGGLRVRVTTPRWGWLTLPAPVVEACNQVAVSIVQLGGTPFGVMTGEWGAMRVRENTAAMAMLEPYIPTIGG